MEVSKDIIADILNIYLKIRKDMDKNNIYDSDCTFSDIVDMIYEEM